MISLLRTQRFGDLSLGRVNEIDKELETLVQKKLTPSEDYVKTGNMNANKVFKFLQEFKEFDIGRALIAGSMGKGTGLGDDFNPDYDLVVFLNNESKPFTKFLSFFDGKLKEMGKQKFGRDYVHGKKTPFSLKFEIGKYKFDLLPAINLNIESKEGMKQQQEALELIRKSPRPSSKDCGGAYSTCLAELSVDFVRSQDVFIRKVIRLAKYWNKSVAIEKDVYIPGRSAMIEIIAIHANAGHDKEHLWNGFKRFLIAMTQLDTLDVRMKSFYSDIPAEVIKGTQLPHVFDPVNPYNNIAHRLGRDLKRKNPKQDPLKTMAGCRKAFMDKASKNLSELDEVKGGKRVKTIEQVIEEPNLRTQK